MKVIIKNEHFKNSSGYWNSSYSLEDTQKQENNCPLWAALRERDGVVYAIGNRVVTHTNDYRFLDHDRVVYEIPMHAWNSRIVEPLVEKAKSGEIIPDFELELEEVVK